MVISRETPRVTNKTGVIPRVRSDEIGEMENGILENLKTVKSSDFSTFQIIPEYRRYV